MDLREQLQRTLGDAYTLERELGGGGMSRVFAAEEVRLKRKVVVKVLSPELAQGISVERFEREIQVAAALQQANIVPVLSAGDTNGLPFYTMPFVEGESLRARLSRGLLAVSEVVGVVRDVARALAYAHERGVVHRDIKPDNVLLSGGTAVVVDFGIAKAISASRMSHGDSTLTQVGTSIGTPAYMAPEQAAGDPDVDHRADIYSLGCMAYELLTGQPPFAARTPQRTLAAHMSEVPKRVSELRPDVPPALEELVMACLAKDAKDRPQNGSDIAHALDGITTGTAGMQAMPTGLFGGSGAFTRALAIYAAAFAAVLILAKAAIVGIGLPDWVFTGSLVVMALGLPIVLWTGYVQRVTRRAMAMTPAHTPGGSPAAAPQGTLATMALKAAPQMSWQRTARGGMYALGAFVVVIAAFMGMRALGIGPFGSLIASGAMKASDRVLITDFAVSNADSALGRVVGDAIRAGLAESRVFTLVTPAEVAAALQRMQRPEGARIDLALARQIAAREGIKAIVDGDVTLVGTSYIVATRLVTADSGRELASYRAAASGSDAIITVADELSRKLRAKAGESLKRVRGTPALADVTTSSLAALRKYSEGARANDVDRDYRKAVPLLREAVALDSNFAEGWRKLGVALRNSGGAAPSSADSAIARAFSLRDRITPRERDLLEAYYYSSSPGYDRARAIAMYDRVLARGDTSVAVLNNLGLQYNSRRSFAKAETLFRAAVRTDPAAQTLFANWLSSLQLTGNEAAWDSAVAVAKGRFPKATIFTQMTIDELRRTGKLDAYRAALDSAQKAPDPRAPSWATGREASLARDQGRLRDMQAQVAAARAIDSAAGRTSPGLIAAGQVVTAVAEAELPVDPALRTFEAELARFPLERVPILDRPYNFIAQVYASADKPDLARAMLSRYDAAVRDTAYRRWDETNRLGALSSIAYAERRWRDAVDLARKSDVRPDGPASPCVNCLDVALIRLFADANMPDSALKAYEDYKRTVVGARKREGPDVSLGATVIERLARIYDAKGDTVNAVDQYRQFIELWKNADPALQPRVAVARERLKKLTPVERPR